MYAYPVICSLFEQNQDSEVYLYLVSEDLEEEDICEEQKLAKKYGNHIIILHFDEEMAKGKIVSVPDHWPLGTLGCYWMFHELLPAEVDRILALESDAVVTGSLREFYDTDLTGYYAACPDPSHKPVSHQKLMECLKGDVLTFVVSVYNVQAIRKDFSLEQILGTDQYVVKEFGHSQQELTFGILFKGKIKFLPSQNLCVEENRQSMEAFGLDYFLDCEKECRVLHFSSTVEKEKPWNPVFLMPGYYRWWQYALNSPYYKKYFEAQWETYSRKLKKTEALKKNITWRNMLLMILAVYMFWIVCIGVVMEQAVIASLMATGGLILSICITICIRKMTIWGQRPRNVERE